MEVAGLGRRPDLLEREGLGPTASVSARQVDAAAGGAASGRSRAAPARSRASLFTATRSAAESTGRCGAGAAAFAPRLLTSTTAAANGDGRRRHAVSPAAGASCPTTG